MCVQTVCESKSKEKTSRLIIPHVRDRGFKSRPRKQFSTNSVRAFCGPDSPGFFCGGDKMATNAGLALSVVAVAA
jgi:hypothetical protein